METYKPINCGYHDYLEHFATLKSYIRIQYFDDIHAVRTTDAIITDLQLKNGEEFAILSSGEEIRLDQLISVGGHTNPAHGFDDLSCECD